MARTRTLCLLSLLALSLGALGRAQEQALPNLSLRTLGGLQLWADVHWRAGWRIQRHLWTGHHRLLDPHDVRRGWGSQAACRKQMARHCTAQDPERLVIMIHGLGRTRHSWNPLAADLERAGIPSLQLSYASTRRSPRDAARDLDALLSDLPGVPRVDFVTHSLGSLVLRELLAEPSEWRGRVRVGCAVLIAPPNQGAAIARCLRSTAIPRALADLVLGEALAVLARQPAQVAPAMDPTVPTVVLAAARGTRGGYNPLIPGDDDGLVGLAETRLSGARSITVRGLHTFVVRDERVRSLVLGLLQ